MNSGEENTPSVVGNSESNNQPEEHHGEKMAPIKPLKTPKAGSLGTLVLIATVIALLGTGALFLYKTSRATRLSDEKRTYDNLIAQMNSGDLKTLGDDLQEIEEGKTGLESALASRVYWSKFWDKLSAVIPKSVYLSSLSIDSSNVVSVSGSASDMTGIAKFMVSLQGSPLFSDIALGNTSVSSSSNSTAFSLTFKINPSELLDK